MLSREELLYHYPSRYEDLRNYERGAVTAAKNIYTRSGKSVQKITVKINQGVRELTFFNQPFLIKTLRPGVNVSLAGNEYEVNGPLIHTGRLVPVYPEIKGLSSKWLRRQIYNHLKKPVKDWLPDKIKTKYGLINLDQALRQIHFPVTDAEVATAKKRLAFDEMLKLQLEALTKKTNWQKKKLTHNLVIDQEKLSAFIGRLPLKLTSSQNQAVKEILNDLSSSRAMNRLLAGEVGSGKTVVAAIALYAAYLNGVKAILMAPTEILVEQHYQTLKTVFSDTPVKIGRVTKTYKENGDILLGTHALLFKNLGQIGLLVIDEQHRFGVKQRSLLLKQGPVPHFLSMTATPIPRTMALTTYAHLNLSVLANLPGKQFAKTWVVPEIKRPAAYQWLKNEIKENQSQAFIVCPLINPSEKESMKDIKAVTQEFNYLKSVFNQLKLALLHGQMKTDEKNKIIKDFSLGKTDILVATPVIEVGIDIPQAAIMVIEGAERYGLAQLHQLRGRVGRRGQKAFCLLFAGKNLTRLKKLETIDNGLKLAELDLKLRGPGETLGVAQHGFLKLKLADPWDLDLITLTREAATAIINSCHLNQNEKSPIAGKGNAGPSLN